MASPSLIDFDALTFSYVSPAVGRRHSAQLDSAKASRPLLFDIGWEVARKVGGIYTVLTTKAEVTVREWGDRFAFVGPFYAKSAATEFEQIRASEFVTRVIDDLYNKHGIRVFFGRWLVKGYPRVFLLDLDSSRHKLAQWRTELQSGFEKPEDNETNDAIIFGYQVAHFLRTIVEASVEDRPILAHFHEWQAAAGLVVTKRWNLRIATLFTTHATLLGRWISAANIELYGRLPYINPDEEAGKRNIYPRHWIECGAARGADIFTTVSEITGDETQHLLGRKPDVLTPNGLSIERFTALHEFQNLHKTYKEKINDFVRGHFRGKFTFDLNKTLYFFTAGRREYHNKGVDLFIESLAELNFLLKKDNIDVTVVAFIIMPGETNSYNVESIKGQSIRREILETCDRITKSISERMYESIMEGKIPEQNSLLSTEDLVDIKRRVLSILAENQLPPIVTHNMMTDGTDEILNHLRAVQLFNNIEDKVKVIYHPEYLNATNPVFPMDYHQFVRGTHMGVFPSYYEPWGYTPAECTIMGVPSITSNLSGFANYMSRRVSDPEANGIFIVDRRFKGFPEAKSQMANMMWRYCQLSRRDRINLRNKTERLSAMLSWEVLGKHYVKARNQALKKVFGMTTSVPEFFERDADSTR